MSTAANVLNTLISTGPRRELGGVVGKVIPLYATAIAVWVIYSSVFTIMEVWLLATIFICALYGLLFVAIAPSPAARLDRVSPVDWVLSLSSMAAGAYFILTADEVVVRIIGLDALTPLQLFFGTVIFVNTLEATRRCTGLGLTLIVLAFIAYNLLGHRLGGFLSHNYVDYGYFLDITVFSTEGILGLPARVAGTYAFLFVMFGVFLSQCGGGDFFFNLAAAATGKQVGGPAKVAVVSSGLYGMMSGSATSDVVTTGSITIPMMKRLGYKASFAGAVETAASAGGALVPPVMGSAVFIMSEYTGIDYREIVIAAIGPAILYYLAIYTQVHFRSKRLNLVGIDEAPRLGDTLRKGWVFIVPLVVITTVLMLKYSPSMVAAVGVATVIAVAQLHPRHRMTFVDIFRCLGTTTMRIVPLAGAMAAAGLVMGGINMTGLANKLASLIFLLTDGMLFPTLLVTAGLTIVLGFGMPGGTAYLLSAVMVSSVLMEFDLSLLVVHMFLLFFAIMSAITPPIAVAAYAAATIAEANPLVIAGLAVRLALAAFVVPFAFIYGPELLMIGEPFEIAIHLATAAFGFFLLGIAAEGYYNAPLCWWRRLGVLASGLLFVIPNMLGIVVGGAVLAVVYIPEIIGRRRAASQAALEIALPRHDADRD